MANLWLEKGSGISAGAAPGLSPPHTHASFCALHHTARRSRLFTFRASAPFSANYGTQLCSMQLEEVLARGFWKSSGFSHKKDTWKGQTVHYPSPRPHKVRSPHLELQQLLLWPEEDKQKKTKDGHKGGGGEGWERPEWSHGWAEPKFLSPDFPYKKKAILSVQGTGLGLHTAKHILNYLDCGTRKGGCK